MIHCEKHQISPATRLAGDKNSCFQDVGSIAIRRTLSFNSEKNSLLKD
jgi:hypothetical protein